MRSSLPSVVMAALLAFAPSTSTGQFRYSTGGVDNYPPNSCGGPSLKLCVQEVHAIQSWYDGAGFGRVSTWENGNVWGSDFRDGNGNNDTDPSGGSDLPNVYFFAGHGACENPPMAGSGDFIITCGNFGKPDVTRVGTSSLWGNGRGRLQFMFLDASCPMDLPEVESEWFAPFDGLHIATGNSGDVNHDVFDSVDRGASFAAYTVGATVNIFGFPLTLLPQLPVGDAWMNTGIIDVQSQNCAVALAAGETRDDAINRRENEFVTSGWSNPTPNWFAWKWICTD